MLSGWQEPAVAGKKRDEIRESEISGLKNLDKFEPLLARLHPQFDEATVGLACVFSGTDSGTGSQRISGKPADATAGPHYPFFTN